jgi:hypothetical protein
MHDLLESNRLRQVRFDHVAAIETKIFCNASVALIPGAKSPSHQ